MSDYRTRVLSAPATRQPKEGEIVTEPVLDRWHLGERIGKGGFGRVYEATSDDGVAVVKFVPKEPGADRELLLGVDLVGATNIIPVIESGETETDWVLVMPRAEKSLQDYLAAAGPALDQAEAIGVLVDVAAALGSIHGRVVHRDLKPGNILLYQGRWCLADFGISRYAEATTDPATRKFAMTPAYAAPEQWRHDRATGATDVYTFGVVAFQVLSGRLPFGGPSTEDFREQHLHGPAPALPGVPPALAALVGECLYKAPEARPTPANILARLRVITPTPPSVGIQKLQAASLVESERRAEHERQSSAARSAEEQRATLADAAAASLAQISPALRDTIMAAAPAAKLGGSGRSWTISLGNAVLSFSGATQTPPDPWGAWDGDLRGLDVVAHASLTLRIPATLSGWEGRGHSLWFCNRADRNEYAWFEGAFMNAAILARPQPSIVPYALPPSEDAAKALSNVMSEVQVAWQLERLTPGDLERFIDRWADWFGDAVTGNLHMPTRLPER